MRAVSSDSRGDAAFGLVAVSVGLGIGWLDIHTTEVGVTIVALLCAGLFCGFFRPTAAWLWALLLALGLPAMAMLGRVLRVRVPEPVHLDPRIVLVALGFALAGCYSGVLVRRVLVGLNPPR